MLYIVLLPHKIIIMKQSITFFLCLLGACYIWFGHSSGAANRQDADRTGGPLSQNGSTYCSMCHSGGSFGTDVFLTLLDENGDTITEYQPETAYTLRVAITAEGASAYGFQAVALDTANAQAGTYGEVPAGTAVVTVGGVDYAEHDTRDDDGTWDIPWTSPAINTGAVSFYAAGNAVNNADGTSGDEADTTSLTVAEALGASVADVMESINLEVSPNPAIDRLRVEWSTGDFRVQRLRIVNATGQLMSQVDLTASDVNLELNISDLPGGIYFVQAQADQGIHTKRIMKL